VRGVPERVVGIRTRIVVRLGSARRQERQGFRVVCRGCGVLRKMYTAFRFPIALLSAGLLVACAESAAPTRAAPEAASASPGFPSIRPRVVAGEYIVKLRDSGDRVRALGALRETPAMSIRSFRGLPGLHLVKFANDEAGELAKSLLASRSDVEYIEPNYVIRALALPNDPRFTDQWGLNATGPYPPEADIDAPEAWNITTGSDSVVVAVIDSGIDYTHADLAANIYSSATDCDADSFDDDGNGYVDDCHGIDVVDHDSDPMDERGHGTHVAGIIGAVGDNGLGIAGVSWRVKLLPCRFLDKDGEGDTAGALACLDYIAALKSRGVNIIASNNSWGSYEYSRALNEAIAAQRQSNILFVAAAGNEVVDVDKDPIYPCASGSSNIVCVASTDESNLHFGNWGRHSVLVEAPGSAIWSTVPGNQYAALTGTSMATPFASGVAALLSAQNPSRDWRALKNLIISGADPYVGSLPLYNAPRLNAAGSLTCANRTVLKRTQPVSPDTLLRPAGAPVVISVLHVQCASPAGVVSVSVSPSGEVFPLRDDGVGADEAAGDGVYTATWITPAAGSFELTVGGIQDDPVEVRVEPLKAGFPVPMRTSSVRDCYYGGVSYAITVGDIAGDAHPEILVPGMFEGPLYAWDFQGRTLNGWPAYTSCAPSLTSLGELDGDASHVDIITHVLQEGLRRLSPGGVVLPGWPPVQDGARGFSPALADLNGDGRDEIIAFPVYNTDGSRFASAVELPAGRQSVYIGPPAVADLDADGLLDIVTADPSFIWATNTQGMLPGFPITRTEHGGGLWSLPVLGDVDGDGELEIVAGVHQLDANNDPRRGFISIYSSRGALERSIALGDLSPEVGEVVLADLDGDGVPEILSHDDHRVFAFRGDGSVVPGWPFTLPADQGIGISYLLVGDITGSGRPNVVFANPLGRYLPENGDSTLQNAYLYALNADGTVAAGFPKGTTYSDQVPVAAIADMDLDGRNDLLTVAPPGYGVREAMFAWDFSQGPTSGIEWGQYRGGADRRAYYETGKNLSSQAYVVAHSRGNGTIAAAGINCGADCIERYAKGTSISLAAAPGPQSTFSGWKGACAGQGNPCTLRVDRFTSVTALFTAPLVVQLGGSGSGRVTTSPGGLDCPTNCVAQFGGGSVVTLVASASAGSAFNGWSGACTGLQSTCRVTMDSATSVGASFTSSWVLNAGVSGPGGGKVVSEPAGLDCGAICTAPFTPGASVALVAQPASDSYFMNWAGVCSSSIVERCTVSLDADKSATATFGKKPVLTVQITGSGGGRITSEPAGLDCGTQCTLMVDRPFTTVRLSVEPGVDAEFISWGGGCVGNAPLCFPQMDQNRIVTADFLLRPSLFVSLAGDPALGKVTSSIGGIDCGSGPCSARYDANTTVVLTAAVSGSGTFGGWSGACTGTSTTCTLTMSQRRSVTATFSAVVAPPPPSGNPGGGSGGSGSGGGGRADVASLLALLALLLARRRFASVSQHA
jgi:hypothetical protein